MMRRVRKRRGGGWGEGERGEGLACVSLFVLFNFHWLYWGTIRHWGLVLQERLGVKQSS